jgi:uncharacterized protein
MGSTGKSKRCPICRASVTADSPAPPFCSERCRLIDLGRWLGEEYRVPDEDAERVPDDDEETQ